MPVTLVKSAWASGDLIFFESGVGRSTTGDILKVGTSAVMIGNTAQDVDFQFYGTGSKSAIIDCGAGTFTLTGITAVLKSAVTAGADAAGVDVTFYGAVTGYKVWFDANGDTNGALYVGADTKGILFNLYGDTTGCGVFWNPSTDTNGTLSVGATGGSKGVDFFAYGATSGCYMQWDQSADALSVIQTNASASGVETAVSVQQTHTGIGAAAEALESILTSNVKIGTYGNAIFGKVELGTTGYTDGLIGVICAELSMPGGAIAGGAGTYACFEAEIDCPPSYTATVPIDVMTINAWGTTVAQFDSYGYFLDLNGVTSASGKVWYANKSVPFDAYLRIKVNGTPYYLGVLAQQAAAA